MNAITENITYLFIVTAVLLTIPYVVIADRTDCVIDTSNPNVDKFDRVDNVTTQGHYSGGSVYSLYCAEAWLDERSGNVSFRYQDPGHVQNVSFNSFPNDQQLGNAVSQCKYRPSGGCSRDAALCVFEMANGGNSHVAACNQNNTPMNNSFNGTLCCKVEEICTDGEDNDGDGLVDCADPECNAALANSDLNPTGVDTPQVCNPPSCPQTIYDGLSAYYAFENNTNDTAGYYDANPGELEGDASFAHGIYGKKASAVTFNGSGLVSVADTDGYPKPNVGENDPFSATLWVNADQATASSSGRLLGKKDGSTGWAVNADDRLSFAVGDGSSTTTISSSPIAEDVWLHVTAVYDGTNARLYVDGAQVNSTATGFTPETDANMTIGAKPGLTDGFNGTVDQVREYNRTLTDVEIASFVNESCNNRQHSMECANSPGLCNVSYGSGRYHCNYGDFDDRTENGSYENAQPGTGVCCPPDTDIRYDPVFDEYFCESSDECGVGGSQDCAYDINLNESAWLSSKSDGSSNACNSQVNDLYVDTDEQPKPERRSQACCYVPKDGELGYYYKDGNVKVYG